MEDITFKFNVALQRLWPLLRDIKLILKFSGYHQEIKNVNQLQKWKTGNVLQGDVFECQLFTIKCIKLASHSKYKKIKWEFQKFASLTTFIIVIELNTNTESDETIVYWKVYVGNVNNVEYNKGLSEYKLSMLSIFTNLRNLLDSSNLHLYQFEGCVISGHMHIVKEFLKNPFKLKIVAPLWCDDVSLENNFDLQQIKQHLQNKITYNSKDLLIIKISLEDINDMKYIILDCRNNNTKGRNQIYHFYCMDTNRDIIYIGTANLFQINKDECFFGLLHEFKYPTSINILKDISMRKKYLLTNLKNYIENFCVEEFI